MYGSHRVSTGCAVTVFVLFVIVITAVAVFLGMTVWN